MQIIIGTDIKWPNGLTLDLIAERIFWVDAKLHIITSSDYNGFNRRTILFSLETLLHPFSITTFEDFVYWSDWNRESIFKANKFTGKGLESIGSNQSIQRPMVVHVYHPYKQPDGINHCEAVNGHCSHLCLPSPRIYSQSPSLSCACPDNLVLALDELFCIEAGEFCMHLHVPLLYLLFQKALVSSVAVVACSRVSIQYDAWPDPTLLRASP